MNKLAVVLNGPPGSGKDTLAEAMSVYGYTPRSFKEQLYVDTAQHFGVELEAFKREAQDRGAEGITVAPTRAVHA